MSNKPNTNQMKKWNDVYKYLKTFNEKNAGTKFEWFAKDYLRLKFPKEFKNVWHFSEVPYKVKEHLNIHMVGKRERGLDLIVETDEGLYIGVQVKFSFGKKKTLNWSSDKLANTYGFGEKCDHIIIFTNCLGVDKDTIEQHGSKTTLITGDNLEALTRSEIKAITQKKEAIKYKISPLPFQKPRLRKVVKALKELTRAQVTYPCGYGKTYTSLWTKDRLNAKRTIVLVPSLQLLHQFLNDWRDIAKYIPYLCVCSDGEIDKHEETQDFIMSEIKAPGKVTTDPKKIKAFLKNDEFIIFSTYQSLPKVIEANKRFEYDFMIIDEAHVTAGDKNGLFSLCLNNKNIKAKKRFFQTATPRILSKKIKDEAEVYIACMDNEEIYGPVVDYMSFAEAIKLGILADYEILFVQVSDKEVAQWIRERRYIDDKNTIRAATHDIALRKVRIEYYIHHAIAFFSSRRKANDFVARANGIPTYYLDGRQSAYERKLKINDFVKDEVAILSNARCLQQGVNIPIVNCIYFGDPKNSKTDIVQAVGRALRINGDKNKKAYIVVPVLTYHDEKAEKSAYVPIMKIIRAMADVDERIKEEITRVVYGKGERKYRKVKPKFDYKEIIKLVGWEKKLEESIYLRCIKKSAFPTVTEEQFLEAYEYSKKHGCPAAAEKFNINLTSWQGWKIKYIGRTGPNSLFKTKKDFMPVYKHAMKIGNINQACRDFGIEKTVFHRMKNRFGLSGNPYEQMTKEKFMKIYVYAEKHGVEKACKKFRIGSSPFRRYIVKFKLPNFTKRITRKEFMSIYEYSKKHGSKKACEKFGIGQTTYQRCRTRYNLDPIRGIYKQVPNNKLFKSKEEFIPVFNAINKIKKEVGIRKACKLNGLENSIYYRYKKEFNL